MPIRLDKIPALYVQMELINNSGLCMHGMPTRDKN